MEWVLDTSIALTWCFDDERTEQTEALFDRLATSPAVVPQNWPLEIANVLALAVRNGRLAAAQRVQFVATLQGLSINIDPFTTERALGEILSLADIHRLTTYDAAYLELAMRLGIPLATQDRELRLAATSVGVHLF